MTSKQNELNEQLIDASSHGHLDVVTTLIKKGADVNATGYYGTTALMRASSSGVRWIIPTIIEKGANVNARDNGGNTALIKASYWGHSHVVSQLIENGADINAKDNDGKTALMWATEHKPAFQWIGNLDVIKLLTESIQNQ